MKFSRGIGLVVLLILSGCVAGSRTARTPAPPPPPNAEQLRARAAQFWTAQAAEDWVSMYQFEEPARRAQSTEASFVTSHETSEPFRITSFNMTGVQTEGAFGWVDLDYRCKVRKFADAEPRDVHRLQKWRITENEWYPMPTAELDSAPECPAMRDAAGEIQLRQRFNEARELRLAAAWDRLYEFLDPRAREELSAAEFADVQTQAQVLACELEWVEVVGERGRVRAVYQVKFADPSLTKLPAMTVPKNDRWVRYEDQWYIDINTLKP